MQSMQQLQRGTSRDAQGKELTVVSFEVWSSVQRRLLEDPGYIGARSGADGALVLCWLPGHTPGEVAASARALLQEAGWVVRHEVNATGFAQIDEEFDGLMGRSELVPIYLLGSDELGPAAHDIRLNLTVATGSFAKTAAYGTTVFSELAPRVPVTIVEGDRPVAG
jgi:hypothetical protein